MRVGLRLVLAARHLVIIIIHHLSTKQHSLENNTETIPPEAQFLTSTQRFYITDTRGSQLVHSSMNGTRVNTYRDRVRLRRAWKLCSWPGQRGWSPLPATSRFRVWRVTVWRFRFRRPHADALAASGVGRTALWSGALVYLRRGEVLWSSWDLLMCGNSRRPQDTPIYSARNLSLFFATPFVASHAFSRAFFTHEHETGKILYPRFIHASFDG